MRAIDWRNVAANDFTVASQVWVHGVLHKRRPDTIGFVNGLPLLFAEWKAPTKRLADAHEDNLRDYKDAIPHIFDANGFVILSNGRRSDGLFCHRRIQTPSVAPAPRKVS